VLYGILFSALLSLDSLSVGISLGINKIKMSHFARFIVALISSAVAGISCFAGVSGGMVLGERFCKTAGGALLLVSGIVLFVNAVRENKRDCDSDGSGEISLKEAVFMGITLSLDMLGAGTGFACGGGDILLFPIFAGVFQFCFLLLGDLAGRKISVPMWLEKKIISYLPPVVIIILGVVKMV